MLSLAAIKGRDKSFSEFLNWGMPVGNGIVLNKDGSLLAGFFYRGRDLYSSTLEERLSVSGLVNDALRQLGGGWSVWIDANKVEASAYPAPSASFFPDPVSRMVDDERRRQFEAEGAHFVTEYAMVLQFTPPVAVKRRIVDLLYDSDGGEQDAPATAILTTFSRKIQDFEGRISHAAIVRRMISETHVDPSGYERHHDELVDYLNFTLTGARTSLELRPGAYLDGVIGGGAVTMGETPKYGDRFVAVVWISGFPEVSHPNILDMIDTLPMPLRWSSRYVFMSQLEADRVIGRVERKWRQKSKPFLSWIGIGGGVNQDALDAASEATEAKRRSASGLEATGYYTPVVVVAGASRGEALARARTVCQAVTERGFQATVEDMNAPEAWLGSLPGHTLYNVRMPPLHTRNLADLLPLAGMWTGSETCPCPLYPAGSPALLHAATTGAMPFRFNLHHHDVGHTLVFGPTGAGKTTLLCLIAMQALRYARMRIWAFDYKRGLSATVRACGGKHYDLAGSRRGMLFCPLSSITSPDDLVWANEWIGTLYQLQTGQPLASRHQRDAVHVALLQIAQEPDRTLTHFQALVQDQAVRDAIQPYTLSGPFGHLLDAEHDSISYSRLMAFEMEDLLAMKEQAAIPVLLYLFRQFEKSLIGEPTLLILDEAWIMLGHPVFRAKLHSWLRTLRSKNCAVIMATQSLSDAVRSKLLDVLIEACPTKIALANEEAHITGTPENPGPSDFYRAFGLNTAQIEIIATATRKHHYYVFSPAGRRLISLNLGPIALAFAGASSKEALARVDELERVHGAEWWRPWLAEQTGERVVEYA